MAMEVTGQLVAPLLEPCPDRNDIQQLRDDQCQPVKCTRQPDWRGLDCCHFWKNSPNVWSNDVVHVDQLNPEKFKYDAYRYQVFAKPCNFSQDHYSGAHTIPDKYYVAPSTDVRGLRQTMYIPVLPHKPGGVTDYTFPMTPQTIGEPDVTTACCVPVIPCNPGFQNMTSNIKSDPNYMCQTYNKCNQPMQIGHRRVNINSEMARTEMMPNYNQDPTLMSGAGAQYVAQHSREGDCLGMQNNNFAEPQQPYAVPYPPQLHAPHYTDSEIRGQDCMPHDAYSIGLDVMDDGVNPQHGQGAAFTSVKSVRYRDRIDRLIRSKAENQPDRVRRLKSMYGAFGSYLVATPYTRRHLEGVRDTINHQGNGFSWSYPKYDNGQCYVVERNPRC